MSSSRPEVCHKCQDDITEGGCTAMGQAFHFDCFTCVACNESLRGAEFYAIDGQPYCEADYLETLDRCSVCDKPIVDRILRATNKPFHPECFKCAVCHKVLDNVPFTVAEQDGLIHCIEDYNEKYAPRCGSCNRPIASNSPKEETFRVVAQGKNFHVECYKCEDCGLRFAAGGSGEGPGCYPIDDHFYCKQCHERTRSSQVSSSDL